MVVDLWPLLCKWLAIAALVSMPFCLSLIHGPDTIDLMLGGFAACTVLGNVLLDAVIYRRLWQFAAHTHSFHTIHSDRFVLRYSPELSGTIDPQEVLKQARVALDELEVMFGRLTFWNGNMAVSWLLRHRKIYVYLFPSVCSIQEVVDKNAAAGALIALFCVALTCDKVPLKECLPLEECLRHELTHLFISRWNLKAIPLLSEGLPTWLQGTDMGIAIDSLAASLVRRGHGCLHPLLERKAFYHEDNRDRSDILAASFSGFLLRHFGLESYQRLYRKTSGEALQFDREFGEEYDLTLETAERLWQEELLRKCENE